MLQSAPCTVAGSDAARAHLLELAGDRQGAVAHYRAAASRTRNLPEQRYLIGRAARLTSGGETGGGPSAGQRSER